MDRTMIFSLRKHVGTAILSGLAFAAIGFVALTVFDRGSVAKADFLLVQPNASNQDFYTSFKSAEYLSKVLGEAVRSERFMQAAIDSGKMDESVLPSAANKSDRLTAWRRLVSVSRDESLGMISFEVKGKTEREAYKTMQAVTQVFTEQNAMFRGGDEKSVEVRLLSGPIVKPTPEIGKLVFILSASFVCGAAFGLLIGFYGNRKKSDNRGTAIMMR
jgi:hypothetical protein